MADYPISNVDRRVQYVNSGVGPYLFAFEVLVQTDIAVYRGSTLLTLTSDYTVTINANGTGSVTLTTGGTGIITIVGARAIERTTDFTTGGDLFANVLNQGLDSQTIFSQQLAESLDRTVRVPEYTASTVGLEVTPEPNGILAWDSTVANLINLEPTALVNVAVYATAYADVFVGDGSETEYTLSRNPGSLYNLDISVDGVTQEPVRDYTLLGTVVTFTSTMPINSRIVIKYKEGLPNVSGDSQDIRYVPAGTGAVTTTVQAKLRETVSVMDFGAVGDGVVDDTAAIQAAIDTGKKLYFPAGVYLCNVEINAFFTWEGDGMKVSVLKPFTTTLPCVTNLYEEPDWRFTSITDIGFESAGQNGIGFCFGNPTAYSVGMETIGRVTFNRCGWQYFEKGVYKPYGNIGNVFTDCSFQWNDYGYFAQSNNLLNPSAPIMHAGADTFNQGEVHENLIAGFCILDNQSGNGGTSWNNVIIEYNPGFGIFIDSGALTNPFNPYQFNAPWLENNASAANVSIDTISGLQTLVPSQIEILTSANNYGYTLWGQSGGNVNGINTLNPQAPLGIWRNQDFGLNMIGGGYGSSWTGLKFSEFGDENIAGASIQSFKQTSTNRNMVFNAGSFAGASYESNGSVKIGNDAVADTTPGDGSHLLYGNDNTAAAKILTIAATGSNGVRFYVDDSDNSNAADTVIRTGRNIGTGRSINAGGTVNASGADYAEYMAKSGNFTINKGDICGINSDGKLTNVFSQAVSFVVKSTNPSYVGGDTWGMETEIGLKPEKPSRLFDVYNEQEALVSKVDTDEEYASKLAAYEVALAEWVTQYEAARQTVDRIAFSGQVPVNVTGASAGQYIIPVQTASDTIGGNAISNPTFEQYQKAVGKVIAIESDDRARIIVKIA